jgi:predicted transcriptional regulator
MNVTVKGVTYVLRTESDVREFCARVQKAAA